MFAHYPVSTQNRSDEELLQLLWKHVTSDDNWPIREREQSLRQMEGESRQTPMKHRK